MSRGKSRIGQSVDRPTNESAILKISGIRQGATKANAWKGLTLDIIQIIDSYVDVPNGARESISHAIENVIRSVTTTADADRLRVAKAIERIKELEQNTPSPISEKKP